MSLQCFGPDTGKGSVRPKMVLCMREKYRFGQF